MQSDTTDPADLLATLAEADIVDSDDDSVRLTESFRERRRGVRTGLAEGDEEFVDDDLTAACEAVATESDEELLATAAAVRETADLDPETAAASALALGRIDGPLDDSGAPEGFTPIRGEEIEAFLSRNPTAVLYFWGRDCEPCEVLEEDFETLREQGKIPEDVELAAICGENCYQLVRERYEVGVAPTTIFCANGRPDSRLVGAHQPQTMISEMEIISDS